MLQLLGCNQDGIDQFLNLRVLVFGLIEHLTNEINRVLDFVHMAGFLTLDHDNYRDHAVSGRNVEKKNVIFMRGCKDWRRG
jgi:hypothetical protein